MPVFTGIAEEIEKLQEPGIYFDINEKIVRALGWTIHNMVECEWRSPLGEIRQPPLYTSSFDAAFALVPEDVDWIVGNVNGHMGGTPYAQVGDIVVYTETPILSLCAAALRFRQAIMK